MIRATVGGVVAGRAAIERAASRPVHAFAVFAALVISGCGQSATNPLPNGDPGDLSDATLRVVSGDGQSGEVDGFLSAPLAVEVVDPSGAPIAGAGIDWTFENGAGRIGAGTPASTLTGSTDAAGRVTVEWRLGTTAGPQSAAASLVLPAGVPDKSVSLSATGDPGPADEITVIPAAVTLAIGDSVQLLYEIADQYGNSIDNPFVSWSSDNEAVAEVTASGWVRAVAEGDTEVTVSDGTVEGVAAVTVTTVASNQPPSASITAPTQNVTIDAGQSVTFAGSASDPDGSVVTHLWDFDDGSTADVEDPGAHTFAQAGTYDVSYRVWDDQGTPSPAATRTVTVEDGGPGPSPEILFEDGFEDSDFASRGWYDFGSWVLSNTEARSGNSSLQWSFGAGAIQPVGVSGRRLFDETSTLYVSYWVKYSTNWVGSGLTYNPHEILFLTNEDGQYTGPAFTALTLYVEHVHETGGNVPVVSTSDRANIDQSAINQDLTGVTEDRGVSGCNGNSDGYPTFCWNAGANYWNEKTFSAGQPYFTDAPGPGYKNDWHQVEVYVELNSIQGGIGQNDGVIRYWFDGDLVMEYDDVLLRTGIHPDMAFNQLIIGPFMEAGSPVAQTFWIDDLKVGTGRPPPP